MSPITAQIAQIKILIENTELTEAIYDRLTSCQVETSLGMPDMAVIVFSDDPLDPTLVTDTQRFALGKAVEIKLPTANPNEMETVMKGEIVAVEPEFTSNMTVNLRVVVYDKAHRMARERKITSFVNVTHSDIVTQIVGAHGLQAEVTATTSVVPYYLQGNVTDLELLQELAMLNERVLYFRSGKVYFQSFADMAPTPVVTLNWGENLLELMPRIGGARQVNEVEVRGWNWNDKAPIVGNATSPTAQANQIGDTTTAQTAYGAAKHIAVTYTVHTQSEAETVAKRLLNQYRGNFITASGHALGDARVLAGKKITIGKVTSRFNGTYTISSVTHIYSANGYVMDFTASGTFEPILADLIERTLNREAQIWPGVYTAIVTNNNDTEKNLGRVKIKMPWLHAELESDWVRVATPNGGNGRGFLFVPEVNDEVLVAFENGDIKRPYVIGALHNGQDAAPLTASDYHANGATKKRILRSRTGHKLEFDDTENSEKFTLTSKSGHILEMDDGSAPKITLKDKNGELTLTMDSQNKKIVINANATGGMDLLSQGKITIKSSSSDVQIEGVNVNTKASAEAKIEGATLTATAQGTGTVKANGSMTVEGSGSLEVKSTGITTVSGSLVKIN
jgi:Rhs element Vgr protein